MANIEREKPRQLSPEQIAAREVEGYIEQIEHQPEVSQDLAGMIQAPPKLPTEITDEQGQVVATSLPEDAYELPLTKKQIEEAKDHSLVDAVRWLREFCVMIINKYPGRVFYKRE